MRPNGTFRWYIDALDARAGRVFASYRRDGDDLVDAPSAFMGPPNFSPQWLPHRGLGLSATRRTFQPGLFAAGEEVPFSNLDDIAEFTRRAYTHRGGPEPGGGGEGPGGGGPPTDDSGPDDGTPGIDDRPRRPTSDADGPNEKVLEDGFFLERDIRNYREIVRNLRLGESRELRWSPTEKHGTQQAETAIARATGQIWQELKQRGLYGSQASDDLRRMASNLTSACLSIGATGNDDEPFRFIENYRIRPSQTLSPLAILATLPIPKGATKHTGAPRASNLLTLLSEFVASPTADTKLELVVFAAACINAAPLVPSTYHPDWPYPYYPFRKLDLMPATVAWLTRQLPRRAFSPPVESAIAQS